MDNVYKGQRARQTRLHREKLKLCKNNNPTPMLQVLVITIACTVQLSCCNDEDDDDDDDDDNNNGDRPTVNQIDGRMSSQSFQSI